MADAGRTFRAEMCRMVSVMVRSGRSTRPATHQPSTTAMPDMMASATPDCTSSWCMVSACCWRACSWNASATRRSAPVSRTLAGRVPPRRTVTLCPPDGVLLRADITAFDPPCATRK